MERKKPKQWAKYILISHILVPSLKTVRNVFFGFCVFIFIAWLYPFLPIVGGIERNEFASQQLISTIKSYIGEADYKIYETDFLGFGEKSYLLVSDNTHSVYKKMNEYETKGKLHFLVLQEIQQNPIDKIIFSGPVWKKAFEYTFENSELSFSQIIKVGNKDVFLFCIKNNLCGSIQYKSNFKISPLFEGTYGLCHENIKNNDIELSKISSTQVVTPLFHQKESPHGYEQFIVAFPTTVNEKNEFIGSSKFQFCIYDVPFDFERGCYITKEKYTAYGTSTVTGDLKEYFDRENDFYTKLLFAELEPCKRNFSDGADDRN